MVRNDLAAEGRSTIPQGQRGQLGGPCRSCGKLLSQTFVDLGMSPLCESYLRVDQITAMEPYYPLQAVVCDECFLVQLGEFVSPEHIFDEYAYFSSYSTSWLEHSRSYCEMIARRLGLGPQSFVIELGSNDGYLLQHFQPMGIPVLGIDPARNVAQTAIEKGIATVVDFFGSQLAARLASEGIQADLICGANVLAQVPDLNDFLAGIPMLLKPDGVCTIEFPHLERLMAENQFDTIYHEHFCYFSAHSLQAAAARHGLRLFDVDELPTHGGSLRVYLAHEASTQPQSQAVKALLAREAAAGLTGTAAYRDFGQQVIRTKRRLLELLIRLKDASKTIAGYGAPGKGNTLLNYCGIGVDFLDYTVDRNPYKHGLYTPGMHIPIHPVDMIDATRPDYVLILPWNLKDEIMRQMQQISEWGGKFITPIPEAAVIDPVETVR